MGSPRAIALAGLTLLVIATYAGVWNHEFLTYDDDRYVTANPMVRAGLTADGLRWSLTATVSSNWQPVTLWSHMLDCELFGLDPTGHHVTNLALHLLNTLLLFGLLHAGTGALGRSAVVAALFAVHPLRVESVAWVAERKDLLSVALSLLTVWAYARWTRVRNVWLYAAALVSFALALMSKSMVVTLPLALLLLDVWPLGRLTRASLGARLLEKVPLGVLSLAAGATALVTQSGSGALQTVQPPLAERLAHVVVSYARYLGKAVWPADLAVFYPQHGDESAAAVALSGVLLALATALAVRAYRRAPQLLLGWAWFVGTLVPVIGFVRVGNQAIADRYLYLPLVGLLVGVVWAVPVALERIPRLGSARRVVATALAALAVAGCVAGSRAYLPAWRDTLSLFEHALETTHDNATAHNTVGWIRMTRGENDRARAHFDEALRIAPGYALAWFNRGQLRLRSGDAAGAADALQHSVELRPGYVPAQVQLGVALARSGRTAPAVAAFRRALELDPSDEGAARRLLRILLDRPDLALPGEPVRIASLRAHRADAGPLDLEVLAAALAAEGDLAAATRLAERAVALARERGEGAVADAIARRARHYAPAVSPDPGASPTAP